MHISACAALCKLNLFLTSLTQISHILCDCYFFFQHTWSTPERRWRVWQCLCYMTKMVALLIGPRLRQQWCWLDVLVGQENEPAPPGPSHSNTQISMLACDFVEALHFGPLWKTFSPDKTGTLVFGELKFCFNHNMWKLNISQLWYITCKNLILTKHTFKQK